MQRCSQWSAAVGEPLAGTTPVNRRWLCVEHPGPWAPDITGSDPVLVALHERARRADARLQLIRRPGLASVPYRRQAFAADTTPGASRLTRLDFTDPRELLDVDLDDEATGSQIAAPLLLVCTHGRRDQCCAIEGRVLVAALPGAWECTHLGGHRFAPTAVVLPTGYAYGRLDAGTATAVHAAAAAGQVHIARCRGRSTWRPAGQVAELAVRELTGERASDALTVALTDIPTVARTGTPTISFVTSGKVRVDHRDGRSWLAQVEPAPAAEPRPSSCGAEPTPAAAFAATGVWAVEPAAIPARAPR